MSEEMVTNPNWTSSCLASYDKIMSSDLGQCVLSSMKVGNYRETRFEEFRINTLNGQFKSMKEWTTSLVNMIDQIIRDFGRNNEICSGLLTIKLQIEEVFSIRNDNKKSLKDAIRELTEEFSTFVSGLPDNIDEYNDILEKNSKILNPYIPEYHPYKFPEPLDSIQIRQLYSAIKNIKTDNKHAEIGKIINQMDPIYSKDKGTIKFNIISSKNSPHALSYLYSYFGLENPSQTEAPKEETK